MNTTFMKRVATAIPIHVNEYFIKVFAFFTYSRNSSNFAFENCEFLLTFIATFTLSYRKTVGKYPFIHIYPRLSETELSTRESELSKKLGV